MTKAWMCLLGVLGIVTTSLAFTVERSIAETSNSKKNLTVPIFEIERRASIEKFFNGEIHSVDIENMLRDSGSKDVAKLPDEECSSSSEKPQRAKRSEKVLDNTNQSTIAEKMLSEPKDTMIVKKIVLDPKESMIPEITVAEHRESKITKKNVPELKKSTIANNIVSELKEAKIDETIISEPNVSTTAEKIVSDPKKSTHASSSSAELESSEITSVTSMDGETLKNVVILLIDDAGTPRDNLFKNFEAVQKFPVKGLLQNCRSDKLPVPSNVRFSLGGSLVSGKKDEECDCDRSLRANVGSLLFWARHVKEMTTGAVSTTNFSIPSSFGYDASSSQLAKDFEDNDEMNGMPQEVSRFTSDPKDSGWRLLDLEKQSPPSASANVNLGSSSKQDGINGYDGMWDVFDMFSRIRIAFFRILLESLGNMTGSEDEFSGRKTITVQPSLVDLVTDAVRELKSVPNDKGFMLVVAAPGNELSTAVDVLQREISTKETLLVIAGICSTTNDLVPFFAHGPGEKWLSDARTIWDLPKSIKSAMSNGCQDDSCKNERREEPLALPSLGLLPLPQNIPHKRVIREKSEERANETTTVTTTTLHHDHEKMVKSAVNVTEDNKASTKEASPEVGKRSGASNIQVDNVARILGIVTSIAAMLAINS